MVLDDQEKLDSYNPALAKSYFANHMYSIALLVCSNFTSSGSGAEGILKKASTEKVLSSFSPSVQGCVFFEGNKAISLDYQYESTENLDKDIKLLTQLYKE